MMQKPRPTARPAASPQHDLAPSTLLCRRCDKGAQQIEHGAECVSDEAVALGLLWQRMRRAEGI
jgi:hypothetical protein